ncbi:GTPase HflX [Chthonobacter rhizosphaerae]|uniref:GTPase HflX n=1 Tax=Chthonobacter rhizosphaerae TaxID=2735553 RepID=UPI0015EF3531|nr:GTPase HflX [Chthonobacter rhizosphaerae]
MDHRDPRDESGLNTPKPRTISRLAERTKAIVVVPEIDNRAQRDADRERGRVASRSMDARVEEAVGLALAIDLDVRATIPVRLTTVRPATLVGTGKLEEIKLAVATEEAELVIVDHALTPIQQRNLEKGLGAKVLDRTGLILEIFGERAHTREGRLQVDLAHLNYQKSRLVRSWTHLERQRGGFGFMGGPGETQIEADRRQLQDKISRLEEELEQVRRTRDLHRRQRQKAPHPVIALVGYTNAGKSTLFNRLTSADVLAQNLLFATLDPTLRKVRLPHGTDAILSDTVGFISNLPTHLVAAFRATLEEVVEATIILHVRDISHPDTEAQAEDVSDVLRQLDVNPEDAARVIEVWNKIDALDPARRESLLAQADAPDPAGQERFAISAVTGEGLEPLIASIERRLVGDRPTFAVVVDKTDGEGLAWLYSHGEVLTRDDSPEDGLHLTVRIPEKFQDEFLGRYRVGNIT